jgi:hypothetical protein
MYCTVMVVDHASGTTVVAQLKCIGTIKGVVLHDGNTPVFEPRQDNQCAALLLQLLLRLRICCSGPCNEG